MNDLRGTNKPKVPLSMWSVIGKGSYGRVYTTNDKQIVLKVYNDICVKEPSKGAKFINGHIYTMMTALQRHLHPNVVEITQWNYHDKKLHVAMERGNYSLLSMMANYKEMGSTSYDAEKCLSMVQDIGRGIFHLHSNNIIHNDINLNNIIVFEDGHGKFSLKLADFDLAMAVNPFSERKMILQTTANMSPIEGLLGSMSDDIWYCNWECRNMDMQCFPPTSLDMWCFMMVAMHIFMWEQSIYEIYNFSEWDNPRLQLNTLLSFVPPPKDNTFCMTKLKELDINITNEGETEWNLNVECLFPESKEGSVIAKKLLNLLFGADPTERPSIHLIMNLLDGIKHQWTLPHMKKIFLETGIASPSDFIFPESIPEPHLDTQADVLIQPCNSVHIFLPVPPPENETKITPDQKERKTKSNLFLKSVSQKLKQIKQTVLHGKHKQLESISDEPSSSREAVSGWDTFSDDFSDGPSMLTTESSENALVVASCVSNASNASNASNGVTDDDITDDDPFRSSINSEENRTILDSDSGVMGLQSCANNNNKDEINFICENKSDSISSMKGVIPGNSDNKVEVIHGNSDNKVEVIHRIYNLEVEDLFFKFDVFMEGAKYPIARMNGSSGEMFKNCIGFLKQACKCSKWHFISVFDEAIDIIARACVVLETQKHPPFSNNQMKTFSVACLMVAMNRREMDWKRKLYFSSWTSHFAKMIDRWECILFSWLPEHIPQRPCIGDVLTSIVSLLHMGQSERFDSVCTNYFNLLIELSTTPELQSFSPLTLALSIVILNQNELGIPEKSLPKYNIPSQEISRCKQELNPLIHMVWLQKERTMNQTNSLFSISLPIPDVMMLDV